MISRRSLLAAGAALPVVSTASAQAKQDDMVAAGFRREVLVRWGDRVEFDAPAFQPGNLTVEAAATQFGWDAVVLGIARGAPAADGVPRGLLAVAHPTAEARMMFPGGVDRPAVAACAQGASLLNIEQRGGAWLVVDGGFQSRRFTASSLCALSGPATPVAGEAIQGLLAVQAGCVTPWGTLLLAEGDPQPWFARLRDRDERFPNSHHAIAYGWVAELDPFDPQAVPVKRTALGRFARAGLVATQSADGHAVIFMTDDRAAGFLFRFVAAAVATPGTPDLLDNGTLSVAVADGGWSVRFRPVPEAAVQSGNVIDAAASLGAATFDAPAGLAMGSNGVLFLACRGAAFRATPDALNPREANPDGHVLLFRPDGRDPAADVFAGEIALLCGDPARGAGVASAGSWISRPANLVPDRDGGLWIASEGAGLAYAAPEIYTVTPRYLPPVGAVMGGVALTPDGATLLSAVRHPGATADASFDRPATRWPSLRANLPPQSTVIGLRQR